MKKKPKIFIVFFYKIFVCLTDKTQSISALECSVKQGRSVPLIIMMITTTKYISKQNI